MSNDIVSDMIKEMQLSPQRLQEISSQDPVNGQMQMPMQMQPGQGGQNPIQMQQSPEQQLQAMQLLQQQEQMKQQLQYQQQLQQLQMQQAQAQAQAQDNAESTESTGSIIDTTQFGMTQKGEGSLVDQILGQLQNPLIVIVAFIIMSLPQVTTGLNKLLRAYISPKSYIMLALRAVFAGGLFYLTNFFLE